ncbi:SDR family NAD(P)-dependent oxidoreductase [Alcaligenaceae bacterium 429]|nr:SDR family NAD(P)-dependent oxidoreductase [Alcaligenaceae bacterium 429]
MVKKVAVIGFSFRLPSHTNKQNYWEKLQSGLNLVTKVDSKRWGFDTFLHPNKQNPGTTYTFAAGSLGDISQFDAQFFGISPREAQVMDPQQRQLLHLAWEAIEDAGIPPSTLRGENVGVYVGISSSDYSYRMSDDLGVIDSSSALGNTASIAANRLSYALDLRGPSMSLDTACSSSLVAFHQACLSIRSGETSMALAGGISLHLHPLGFISFAKATMLSPTGRCQVFDAAGDGYVRSEGGGLFLLKDYDQAVADNDRILAVVLNSGVNTDGHKQGITVPNPKAQSQLIQQTMFACGLTADDLDYVEAHGTGTAIGDPIETRAIGIALGQNRERPLPIGSVKSNMGHLETASGAAGLIKLLYAFKHRQVPPTIGIQTLNPQIDFNGLNLQVNQELLALPTDKPLHLSINSFGFGGSNAHIVLESPPVQPAVSSRAATTLPLLLSARSESSLKAYAQDLANYLQANPQVSLYDVAYHLYKRRDIHSYRTLIYTDSVTDAAAQLGHYSNNTLEPKPASVQRTNNGKTGPVFVFSGNGSQWDGMGRSLLTIPSFLAAIQEVDQLFIPYSGWSLEALIRDEERKDRYTHTDVAQPALFAIQVALVKLFAHYGVQPAAVIGHSVGEVAAAWACGALTLPQAVQVIYERSRHQETTKGHGQMTAVSLNANSMLSLLEEHDLNNRVSIAGDNSSTGCTIAGQVEALDQTEQLLKSRSIRFKRLNLDYAFHSPFMDSIKENLLSSLEALQPSNGHIPLYSVVYGHTIAGRNLDAQYWWQNIRQPVLFEPAIQEALADKHDLFVEIGPHPVLRSYIQQAARDADKQVQVNILGQRHAEDPNKVIQRVNKTLLHAQQPNLNAYFPTVGEFVELPHYAWDLESYWHPTTPEAYDLLHRTKIHHLLGYALPQQSMAWENSLDTLLYPYLGEHIVGDSILLPGSAFLDIALAAAREFHDGTTLAFENLTISTPLVLQEFPSKKIRTFIDKSDGRLHICSRTLNQDESWANHAQARVIEAANNHWQSSEILHVPTTAPDFDTQSHHALTEQVGLAYGPSFTAIRSGWMLDDKNILVALEIPENIATTVDDSILHPALVDSCFQSIIHLLLKHPLFGKGIAFVPVQIESAYARTDMGPVCYGKTRFLQLNPHSLCASFDFYNADGQHIAHLQQVRFRSARLQKTEPLKLSYLDYQLTPRPLKDDTATELVSVASLQPRIADIFVNIEQSAEYQYFHQEIDPLLDSLADLYTHEAVWQYQLSLGTALSQEHLQDLHIQQPAVQQLLEQLVNRLVQTGEAEWQDELLVMTAPEPSANTLWYSLSKDYSEAFNLFLLVARVGMNLPRALAGEVSLSSLRPATVSLSNLLSAPLGLHNHARLLQQVTDQLVQLQHALPAGQRLRILEISEQRPWFAGYCLSSLNHDFSDFSYGSTNSEALDKAAILQESHPQLESLLIESGLSPEADYDLILIAGDFATPQQAEVALGYAQKALRSGGTCLLYGIEPGYWHHFSHADLPAYGVLPQEFWTQQLEQRLGQTSGVVMGDTENSAYALFATAAPEKRTTTATPTSASTHTEQKWQIIADTPIAQAFAEQLVQQLGTDRASTGTWPDMPLQQGQHIVYLGGLQNTDIPLLDAQHQRCSELMQLVQQYPYGDAKLWIVCNQATSYTMTPTASDAQTGIETLNDASTWGFSRSLMNESDRLQVRLIDFPWFSSADDISRFAQLFAAELQSRSPEQEIIYQENGQRYAPRLQVVEAFDKASTEEQPSVRLQFSLPGQLRNLYWQQLRLPELQPSDIKIRIHATGLNFRDVMYTLGMLSDEAVENGFAGASLGLEFSGVVESTGNAVTDYKVGDHVVGFGSHSFGTHTISASSALAHIPDNISYEAAATIPSTFFTVYYALQHLARLEKGERILIHGAAGGVGIAAIQLATHLGAEIYATASSDEKRDFLRLMGVKHIYDSRSLTFADDILADTNQEGIDVVLNSLAGEAINRNLRILRPFGRFLELGKRDFYQDSRIGLRPFRNNISYFGIDADQLMQAKPALTQRLFGEVMQLIAHGKLTPLPFQVFDANNIVDAFRYMQQARQIGKIVVTYQQPIRHVHKPTLPANLQLNPDATYMVTGGLGGFGLRTAQWLAEKGAKHLLLLSRRGPNSEEATLTIAQLTSQGVNVAALACDVSKAEDVQAAFLYAAEKMPPVKGIVHAATVIDDALIMNMQPEQIRRVLGPKVLGALHLHQQSLLLDSPLDMFVVYSSATTLFGNLGQSNYVAANLWLEALTGLRLQAGLAATCVRWGAIDDVGFLARNTQIKNALQDRMGGAALPAAIALGALESMLVHKRSHLGVMELDWSALDRFLPTANSPKFSDLAHMAAEAEHDGNHDNWAELIATLGPEDLYSYAEQIVKSEISDILRLPLQRIDSQQSIYDMGLDSLLGVELVLALENRFDIRIPVMSLNESPTIEKLTAKLISLLQGAQSDDGVEAEILHIAAQHHVDLDPSALEETARGLEQPTTRILH